MPSLSDLTNREFGDYHIIRRIGSGAMAEVYLAEQRSLGRRVALKILKPELAADETYLRRFTREARAVARLTHPNLVQVYQADCLDGYWFIAQEYVQGQTFQALIRKNGPLPYRQVADVLWQICSALEKTAEAGIVHRDIKPENILLDDAGNAKVADFGLARISDPSDSAMTLTQAGMTLGTPLYMSPEQAQGKPIDHRSDMYSLGITCYHALAGEPPFRGETPLSVAILHINEPPKPLEKLRADVPTPLNRLIHQMIAKKPEDRFASFHDVLLELRSLYTVYLHDDSAADRLTDWNRFPLSRTDRMLLAATEKLQKTMQKERKLISRKPGFWLRLFVLAAITLLGIGLGYWHACSIPNPFHEPTSSRISKKQTVEEQWVYACILNSEAAWLSVIEDFPDADDFWARKAKRQLIRHYFLEGNSLSPIPICQEFAEYSDVNIEEQALGLVGLAWCAAENQGNMAAASEYLRRLYEINFPYSDSLLIQILDATSKTIQQKK